MCINKTITRVREKHNWDCLTEDVETFIKNGKFDKKIKSVEKPRQSTNYRGNASDIF